MKATTKNFGEIDIPENKIITFENGLIGYEDFKKYTLIYDIEDGVSASESAIMWLQSMEEPALALPIMKPTLVKEDYNPIVDDERIQALGEIEGAALAEFVTLTVPSDLTKMTCNLKAPIIINADTNKAVQVIAENEDYLVRYPIYEFLKERSGKGGE